MPFATVVAIFEKRISAERARNKLIDDGVAEDDIRLSSDRSDTGVVSVPEPEGILARLFKSGGRDGRGVPYRSHLDSGHTVLSVGTADQLLESVEKTLAAFVPLDIKERWPRCTAQVAGSRPSPAPADDLFGTEDPAHDAVDDVESDQNPSSNGRASAR